MAEQTPRGQTSETSYRAQLAASTLPQGCAWADDADEIVMSMQTKGSRSNGYNKCGVCGYSGKFPPWGYWRNPAANVCPLLRHDPAAEKWCSKCRDDDHPQLVKLFVDVAVARSTRTNDADPLRLQEWQSVTAMCLSKTTSRRRLAPVPTTIAPMDIDAPRQSRSAATATAATVARNAAAVTADAAAAAAASEAAASKAAAAATKSRKQKLPVDCGSDVPAPLVDQSTSQMKRLLVRLPASKFRILTHLTKETYARNQHFC